MKTFSICIAFFLSFQVTPIKAQQFQADVRGADDISGAGTLQLATPNENHFLRLFSGRTADPKPYIYFNQSDTLRLASGIGDFSNFKENLTILNGPDIFGTTPTFIGINNVSPSFELDIRTSHIDDGAEINLGNTDNSHFLRFYSGKQSTFTNPVVFWDQGDTLRFATNSGGFNELLALHPDGTIHADSEKGIALNAHDRPLITRGWDPFTSGSKAGIGRWGLFMESDYLTFGMPDLANRGFQFVSYNTNSTFANIQMTLKEGKLGINNSNPQYILDVNGDANITGALRINDDAGSAGQVLTSNGNSDPTWETPATSTNVGFRAFLTANTTITNSSTDTIVSLTENFDAGSNFDVASGTFTAPGTGVYHFDCTIAWESPGPSYSSVPTIVKMHQKAATFQYTAQLFYGKIDLTSSYGEYQSYSMNIYLEAGDLVKFSVFQVSGSDLTLKGGSTTTATILSGYQIY